MEENSNDSSTIWIRKIKTRGRGAGRDRNLRSVLIIRCFLQGTSFNYGKTAEWRFCNFGRRQGKVLGSFA